MAGTKPRGDNFPPLPPSSPVEHRFDDNFGKAITIRINFNNTTRALTSVVVTRDDGCQWSTILVGLGPDGVPDSTDKAFRVPAGVTTVTSGQLSARGLNTIEDVRQYQITAGR